MPETLSSPAAASPIKGYQHRNRYFASFSLCHQRIQVVFPLHWFRVEAAQSKRNFPCKPLRQCRHPLEGFNKPGRNQSEAIFHSWGDELTLTGSVATSGGTTDVPTIGYWLSAIRAALAIGYLWPYGSIEMSKTQFDLIVFGGGNAIS